MVKKIEVRQRLALCEKEIKEEIKKIEDEIFEMDNACTTQDLKRIWRSSVKYSALSSRRLALTEVLWNIRDIRCGEMLND